MALNAYTNAVKSLLHDFNLQFYGSPFDITGAINTARNRVAADGQCIRILPTTAGSITAITVLNGGNGYTAPTVTVNAGTGSGATFTTTVVSGVITAINVTSGGTGYTYPVTIVISDTTGTGAIAIATIPNINTTIANQEVYTFASVNPVAQLNAGVQSIQGVFSVAVNQGAWKPTLKYLPWGQLQAYYRSYNASVLNYPEIWSQYGQGVNGSVYLYPVPSDVYSMDWDCYCLPVALVDDTTPEAIPYPWTDAIPYYAAYLAYQNAQRAEDAARMMNDYQMKMREAGGFARPVVIPNYYGRKW